MLILSFVFHRLFVFLLSFLLSVLPSFLPYLFSIKIMNLYWVGMNVRRYVHSRLFNTLSCQYDNTMSV